MLAFAVAGQLFEVQAFEGVQIAFIFGGANDGHHIEEGINHLRRIPASASFFRVERFEFFRFKLESQGFLQWKDYIHLRGEYTIP